MATKKSPVYLLKVTLLETKPPIWRRLLVEGNVTLARLATIVNSAMGWQGYHLHEFRVGKEVWGPPMPVDDRFGYQPRDDGATTLEAVAPRKPSAIKYQYDAGDCWMHRIVVEEILDPDPKQKHPACTGGQRACPPEDCGGTPGFYNLLDALADPQHPDHAQLSEWLGRGFDPEAFDLERVNESLRRLLRGVR